MQHLGKPSTAPHHTLSHNRARRRRRLALAGCAAIAIAGCATNDGPTTAGPDWCWRYYALAPGGALASDLGPTSVDDADAWATWLEAIVDAPLGRGHAQAEQLRLVDQFRSTGRWTAADVEHYRAAATSDPTPATVCETFGARIIPAGDGSLEEGWDDRFTDPRNAAFSHLAATERTTA